MSYINLNKTQERIYSYSTIFFFASQPYVFHCIISLSSASSSSSFYFHFQVISNFALYFSCKNTDSQIFYDEHCVHNMLKTTPDPFPVSKLTIIAISGGTGGALLLIILITTIFFCYRLKHAKRIG